MKNTPQTARRCLSRCARVAMTLLTIPDAPRLRDWQAPTQPHLALRR